MLNRRIFLAAALGSVALLLQTAIPAPLPVVAEVEFQPFASQVRRLIEACDYLGSPLRAADKEAIQSATWLLAEEVDACDVNRVLSVVNERARLRDRSVVGQLHRHRALRLKRERREHAKN